MEPREHVESPLDPFTFDLAFEDERRWFFYEGMSSKCVDAGVSVEIRYSTNEKYRVRREAFLELVILTGESSTRCLVTSSPYETIWVDATLLEENLINLQFFLQRTKFLDNVVAMVGEVKQKGQHTNETNGFPVHRRFNKRVGLYLFPNV